MKFVPKPLRETADVSRPRVTPRTVLTLLLQAALLLTAIYIVLGIAADLAARTIPDSWERRLGAVPVEEFLEDADVSRPQTILDGLMAGQALRELEYEILILDVEQPNAAALIGGRIGLTTGLLELLDTEEGLAFVLAHELGHHQQRHNLHRLGRGLLFGLFATMFLGREGLAEIQTALEVAESGHSRAQETAADRFAMRLVHARYGDTGSALEFFEKIRETRDGGAWQKYLGSHPLTGERIEALAGLRKELLEGPAPP